MGLIIMAIGVGGILISTAFEIKVREPIYSIIIKISCLVFTIGSLLWKVG